MHPESEKNKKNTVIQHRKRRAVKSIMYGTVDDLNRRIYRFVRDGAVGKYLSGYDKTCEKYKSSYFVRMFSYWKKKHRAENNGYVRYERLPEEMNGVEICEQDSVPVSVRNRFSKAFDSSWLVNFLRYVKNLVLYTPLVTYGVLLFSFALFMLITQAATMFFSLSSLSHLIPWPIGQDLVLIATFMVVAVVLMTVSIVLIFAKEGSLFSFLTESVFSGFVLKHFAGITHLSVKQKAHVRHNGRAFVVGMVIGLLTFVIPPADFFGVIGVLIYAAMVIGIPEFGLVSLIFLLPFLTMAEHPTLLAIGLSLMILFSVALKLIRGKRSFVFEPADFFVTLFLLLVLFGGIFTTGGGDSFAAGLTFFVLGVVYFVVTVLVKDDEWLKRCLNSLMLSSIAVSVIGILEWVFHMERNIWQDNELFASLSGRVVSVWENPNVLAEYLTVVLFISFACLLGRKKAVSKVLAFFAFSLSSYCLVLTWSRGAWVSVVLVFLLLLLLYSHKSIPWVFLLVLCGVLAFMFLPETVVGRVESIFTFSDSSVLYRVHMWQGCSALVRKCFLTGVGIGESAFIPAYNEFALTGVEAPHAHNLLLQLLIELGIMGVVVFVIVLMMLVRSAFSLFRARSFRSFSSVACLGFLSALFALLIQGITDYIWYNNRIYLLFWIVLGLITATRRIGIQKREVLMHEHDAFDITIVLANGS